MNSDETHIFPYNQGEGNIPVNSDETHIFPYSQGEGKINIDPEKQQEVINGISSETSLYKISKTFYNKYEEINNPSSYDPYIGRDAVVYRGLQCDQNYIKDRPFALACQVDLTPNWELQNYDNTGTNIIRTCVYNNKSSDPDVWTRDKCMSECSKIPDLTNLVYTS